MKKIFLLTFMTLTAFVSAQTDYQLLVEGTVENAVMNASYSPDGKNIAYTSAGYQGIWSYNLQSNSNYQLSDEIAAGFGFKWSSDSKSILTRVARYENQKRLNAVKVFNLKDKSSQQLTEFKTMMPYLPHWIDGDSKVFLPAKDVDIDLLSGKEKNNLVNGNVIAFEKNNKIIIKNLADNTEKSFEIFKDVQYINVSISPNGTKIVFEIVGGNLFVINSDGTYLIDLGVGNRPKWSSDSRRIIYMVTEDNGHDFTSSEIYVINSDGTGKNNLTNTKELIEMNPCFSPDGKSIVFDLVNDGSIYLMNIE